jgi:NAD(P)-dependent dehydrogenase (short-subunit alcohol dehydrogenase family)
LTRLLAGEWKDRHLLVNAVCPGWVKTRMGGAHAPRCVEEGADTLVWAATLPPDGPTGGFFRDRRAIPW